MRIYSPSEQDEFFSSHIPHRLTAMMAPAVRLAQDERYFKGTGDVFCGCIEGAFSALRIFIEFLGLKSWVPAGGSPTLDVRERKGPGVKRPVPDTDVMIDNFGLPLVRLSDVGQSDAEFLAMVHDGVSKSTSHFTFDTGHGFSPEHHYNRAAALVSLLLGEHLFRPLGRVPLYHPDLPPFQFPAAAGIQP